MLTFQVIGVNGQEILAPMTLAPSTPVSEVQTLVREALGVPFHITLLHEFTELPQLALIGEHLGQDQCNILMAVAQMLTDDERAQYLARLANCSFGVEDLFKSLPDEAKVDERLVMAFVEADGRVFQHVHQSLLQDRSIVMAAVRKNRRALEISDSAFRKDKEIVLEAASTFGDTLIYADRTLFWDSAFLKQLVKRNDYALTQLRKISNDIKAEPLVKFLSSL
jgi:hypothetical protein